VATAAIAAAALVGPAQVGARLVEFGLLRSFHPISSARIALQAASPFLFGLLLDRVGIDAVGLSAGLCLAAFGSLFPCPWHCSGRRDTACAAGCYRRRPGCLLRPRCGVAARPWPVRS